MSQEEAIKRIKEAEASNCNALDLSWLSLEEIPESITRLQNLTTLNLGFNNLTDIPEFLTRLQNLTKLNLENNKLVNIPGYITPLRNLTTLNLQGNRLAKIPEYITRLQNLTTLDLMFNRLTRIPKHITRLQNLKTLDLAFNYLSKIPECLTRLQNLMALGFNGNGLSEIPGYLANLQNLTMLNLGHNNLTKIPEFLTCLQNLTMLDLSVNKLTEIPEFITQCRNLRILNAMENPVTKPPAVIVSMGLEAIRDYYRQLRDEGQDHLFEAKLLIVGEPGAGKTSLARKIQDSKCKLPDEKDTTRGIEAIKWRFPLEDKRAFQANIWDFGGQEIYHATHQFFLTHRSLYVLVADTRREDTDFYYWLRIVELLGGDSPVLIIKNEKGDRPREINERQLRGEFSNIAGILPTNLLSERGLSEVVSEIKHRISHLKHIGDPLPKTWVRVREALEHDPRNYMPAEEYCGLCAKHGIDRPDDQLQLSCYLHDLGVCLHFQDDPLLKNIIILKPEWGTTAVYRVLDNLEVIKNFGRFSRQDLRNIWSEEKYANEWDELLQLMLNFRLCYQIPGTKDQYIAPQLLTENQPVYAWDENDNLFFRYSFIFMPKGLVTQLIVAMHKSIAEEKLVWKSGVILSHEEAKAEVIELYSQRQIRIRISGKNKKEMLAIIRHELGKILDAYKALKYQELIPCNCTVCKGKAEPYFFIHEELRRSANEGQKIQCRQSFQLIEPLSLIDDLFQRMPVTMSGYWARRFDPNVRIGHVEQMIIQQTEQGKNVVSQPRKEIKEDSVRSPWISGSFYLFSTLVIIAALVISVLFVPLYILPAILVAAVIFVSVIGALQLRQDKRLSEKTFLELMRIALGQLPQIGKLFGKPDKPRSIDK